MGAYGTGGGLEMREGNSASGTDGGLVMREGSGARARDEGRKWCSG